LATIVEKHMRGDFFGSRKQPMKFLKRQKAYESIDRQVRVKPRLDVNGLSSGLKP
jgi:hypothetical protein